MKFDTIILADAANESQGKLNLLGAGITRINAPMIPWTQPQLVVIVRAFFAAEDLEKDHEIKLELLGPDGTAILPPLSGAVTPSDLGPILEVGVEGEINALQANFGIHGILFARAGLHHFVVELDGEEVARHPLPVVLVQQ